MMQLDPGLHRALLAGTARVPLDGAAGAAAPLAPLLGQGGGSALWLSLAAQDSWQRAGFQPAQAGAATPCGPESAAPCPRAAEHVLDTILRGIHPELLPAWLAHAAAHGMVLPPASLAALLEQGLHKPPLRQLLLPLLGVRGAWLASQNPAWAGRYGAASVEAESVEHTWQHGALPQRVAALRAMRASDPAAGLAALHSDWAQEPSENRIALLPCLAVGLSLADEAFLEQALDDRRKEVRRAAQALLAGLPGAQLGERCKARLAGILALGGLSGRSLQVRLPEACDKAMQRDGIGLQKPWNMGEKAGWLMDMVQSVPPVWWSIQWQLDAAAVVRLFAAQEFNLALLTGLCTAVGYALRRAAPEAVEWYRALLAAPPVKGLDLAGALLPQFPHLPQEAQQRVLQEWLEDQDGPGAGYAMGWAQQAGEGGTPSLPPHLSRLFLLRLQGMLAGANEPAYAARAAFKSLALLLAADDLAYVQDGWPPDAWEHWPHWSGLVAEFKETLQFRNALQRSFMENKE